MVRSAPPQNAALPEVMTAPLIAASLVTLSTTVPSSSMASIVMTFIERSGMSHVINAIPSASTSILKLAIAGSSVPTHALVRLAILSGVARALFAALDHHVDVGVMRALECRARADLDKHRIAFRAIDQAMAVRHPRLPGRGIAWPKHGFALVLTQDDFAFEYVDELVLAFVP